MTLSPAARIPSLDGLRALAIAMVVVSHLSGSPGFFTLPGAFANALGDSGVRIFFVLSGYLITTLLLSEHRKTGGVDLPRFYFRRSFRIFPAFYLYLVFLAFVSALGGLLLYPDDLWKAALYLVDYCRWDSTSNFISHIWSLSVEEQFYLVWPLAMFAFGPRRVKWVAVASILLSPLWRLTIFHLFPGTAQTLDRRFDAISDTLATGCLLACSEAALAQSKRYISFMGSAWSQLILLPALLASATFSHPNVALFLGYSTLNISIALYMHRCTLFPPTWLNSAPLRQIGVMSYSIYLWQQVFCSPHEDLPRMPAYYSVPATLAVAWLSYRAVEQPLQNFARRRTAAARLAVE